ncbi:hypothetical protein WDU94_010791 [Cyamophila willieti]
MSNQKGLTETEIFLELLGNGDDSENEELCGEEEDEDVLFSEECTPHLEPPVAETTGPFRRPREYEFDYQPRNPRGNGHSFRGRSNTATKKHQHNRNEKFRERKRDEFQKDLKDEIKEKLHANTEEEDMKILADINAERAQMLSVSTRGIGIGVMLTATTTRRYQPYIVVPNVNVLYRTSLAVLEAKQSHLQATQPIIARYIENIYHYENMLRAARTVVALPQPIARVINAIGHVKYDNTHYIPVVVSSPVTQNGHTVPIPNNILLSNLRAVAVSLTRGADPPVPIARRQR